MAEGAPEGLPRPVPGGGRATDVATLAISAKQKLYELEDKIRDAADNRERYQYLQQSIRKMYAYLWGFKPSGEKQREQHKRIKKAADELREKMRALKVPIPPYPTQEAEIYQDVVTYKLSAPAESGKPEVFAIVLKEDRANTVQEWRTDQYNDLFYEAVNELWEIWTTFCKWLAVLKMLNYDDVVYLARPRVTKGDIDDRINARADREKVRHKQESSSGDSDDDDDSE